MVMIIVPIALMVSSSENARQSTEQAASLISVRDAHG